MSNLPFVQLSASGSIFATSMFAPAVGYLGSHFLAGQTLTSSIIDLAGTSTLSYVIGNLSVASTTDVAFTYGPPVHIIGILKTPNVYFSTENGASTVHVLYSVSDAFGRSQCDSAGVSVSLTVGTAVASCALFSSSLAPHGRCSIIIDSSAFSFSVSTLPVFLSLSVSSALVQTTLVGSVVLAPIPTQSTPSVVGIYFQMPIYQAVPGDTFTVKMWAQTGSTSMTMESWGVSLVYNTTWLSFVSVAHPLYTTVLTNTAVANALNVTGTGGSGGITGWFLAATFSFTVLPASAGSTVEMEMPAILTNAMTNSIPVTYNTNFAGSFADSRGGWAYPSGQVSVLLPATAGLYSCSSRSSFVNTFTLNGLVSTDVMSVFATYNTGRAYSAYADVLIQPSSCTSANPAVFTASPVSGGCLVVLANSGGASFVDVSASYSGFISTVSYRAFFFLSYYLNVTRFQLRRLGCDFESTYLTAYGVTTLDGVLALATLDITNLVIFGSSDMSVLRVSGRTAHGVSPGFATVTFGDAVALASSSITVSSSAASVVELVSYVFSSVIVQPAVVSEVELGTAVLQVQPVLSLTAELQTATVVTYALDDDGVWTDVSGYPSLTLSSALITDLTVIKSGSGWNVLVPVGASSVSSSIPILSGTLTDSCSTPLTSSGYGFVSTNLSVPVAIVVTAASPYLARTGTPAATTLGIATSTQITVMVTFRSALGVLTFKDFTLDSRTFYTANFVNSSGTLSSSATLSLTSSTGMGTAGAVIVAVSMPSYAAAAGLTQSILIPVVDVDTAVPLQGSLVHSVTPSVPVSLSAPLAKLSCTGVYQTGVLASVAVTLTDGSTRSGTPSLSSATLSVAIVSGTTVIALAPGITVITATYATATGTFTAYVTGSSVTITSMSLSYASFTLSGQTGSSAAGSLAVYFSDGTSFVNAIAQFSPLSALVGFNCSDVSSLTVSSSGVVSLINNSWQWATLTAFSNCADGHYSTYSMAGNLLPVNYDTKLGSTSGITFPPVANGDTVDASIKVQVSYLPLTTYQVWLFYNSAVFGTPTITKGSGWPTGAFDFTTNNAVAGNIVKAIISFSSGFSAINTLVQMASVSFPVITASPVRELITANVVALSVTSGSIFQSAMGTPVVAGTAYVSLNGGTVAQLRRLLLIADSAQYSGDVMPGSHRRQLHSVLPLVTGDCNGDGLFNANDATYAQQLVTNGVTSWPLSSFSQMRNCAPTYSYMFNAIKSSYLASDIKITIADVSYLLHASTNRLFFLNISSPYDLVTAVPTANNQTWTAEANYYYFPVSTSVAAFSQVPCASSSAYFEMNLVSLPFTITVGSYYGSTSAGVAIQGSCTAGTFTVSVVTNYQSTLNMSVGFINGATSDAYSFFGMDVGAFINPNVNFGAVACFLPHY